MDNNWIKLTDRARHGIKIINKLSYPTFCNVLEYVNKQMVNSKSSSAESSTNTSVHQENENALEELERMVGISRSDFLLLIKTISYILRRIGTYIIKPSLLQSELKEKLQIEDEAKIDAIVHLWIQQTTPLIYSLNKNGYEENILIDMAWKLNVQISSNCRQNDKTTLALIQLKTCAGEDINWEMNFEELNQLNGELESIQSELNAICPS